MMQCVSSRSQESMDILTDRTLAVQNIAGSRSLLPPSLTAEQLLALLAASGHPCCSTNSVPRQVEAVGWPPASFSPSYITRHCPTRSRVTSSFAAAGAHSLLGEMLQFFADSLTRLFAMGVADPSVRAFPSEWDRRLNSPAAAALRQHHLFELQGFSTLFTYVWGQVAISQPLMHDEQLSELEEAAKEPESYSVTSSVLPHASPKGAVAHLHLSRSSPFLASSSDTSALVQRPSALASSTTVGNINAKAVGSSSPPRLCVPLTSAALVLPEGESAKALNEGRPLREVGGDTLSSRPTASPPALAVVKHALTAQAKAKGPFIPSIPSEGLVLSWGLRENSGDSADFERFAAHDLAKGSSISPSARALFASEDKAKLPSPTQRAPPRVRSVEQAKQLDRSKELQRLLGVRNIRNYAEKGDMQEYLENFQENMQSVLNDSDED